MKKLSFLMAIGAALSCVAVAHEGHEHATGVVRERMELMTDMGQRLLAMSKLLRANKDLDRIAADARTLNGLTAKIPADFPPGSTQFPTAAKPAVWQQWDDFVIKAKKLQTELEKLSTISPADGNALREQFRAVALACDGCHDKYRVPKSDRK
jgi:cytochrome c556